MKTYKQEGPIDSRPMKVDSFTKVNSRRNGEYSKLFDEGRYKEKFTKDKKFGMDNEEIDQEKNRKEPMVDAMDIVTNMTNNQMDKGENKELSSQHKFKIGTDILGQFVNTSNREKVEFKGFDKLWNYDELMKSVRQDLLTKKKKEEEERIEKERLLWTSAVNGKQGTLTPQMITEEVERINTEVSKRLILQENLERESLNEFNKRHINHGESTLRAKFGAKVADKKEDILYSSIF